MKEGLVCMKTWHFSKEHLKLETQLLQFRAIWMTFVNSFSFFSPPINCWITYPETHLPLFDQLYVWLNTLLQIHYSYISSNRWIIYSRYYFPLFHPQFHELWGNSDSVKVSEKIQNGLNDARTSPNWKSFWEPSVAFLMELPLKY